MAEVIKKTKDAQKKMHAFSAVGGNNRYSSATVVKTKRSVDVAAVGGISEAVEKAPETPQTDEWSQNQQKLLEIGIKKYGKDIPDRWDKIAEDVVGKDKVRFDFGSLILLIYKRIGLTKFGKDSEILYFKYIFKNIYFENIYFK